MEAEEELDLLNRYMLAKFPKSWVPVKFFFFGKKRGYLVSTNVELAQEIADDNGIVEYRGKLNLFGKSKKEAIRKYVSFIYGIPQRMYIAPSFQEMKLWLEIAGK